jgi:hypothetical protein
MQLSGLLLLLLTVTVSEAGSFAPELIGCYKDTGNRALKGQWTNGKDMTIEVCNQRCADDDFLFAATQYSAHCFCGDDEYDIYGPADNCNMLCAANNQETCGGGWANQVYRVGRKREAPTGPVKKIGCYRDASSRAMTGLSKADTAMTNEMCNQICFDAGFKYAATEYSKECYCDDVYDKHGEADNCETMCGGDDTQICGGSWAMTVYQVGVWGAGPEEQCVQATVGHEPVEHTKLDTANYWTYVDVTPFPSAGVINKVELFAGHDNRPLKVGIYRPKGKTCEFTLIQQIEFTKFEKGYRNIDLTTDQQLQVEVGDHYGFTWFDHGVVSYDSVKDRGAYCEDKIKPNVGDKVKLHHQRHTNRDYAIRMSYVPASCATSFVGQAPIEHRHVDTAQEWTFVYNEVFPQAGVVDEIQMFVGAANRPLKVGIYREIGPDECSYQLIQQVTVVPTEKGFNKIRLEGTDQLVVKEKYFFGFTWLQQGVLSFDTTNGNDRKYCEERIVPTVGDHVTMQKNRHSNRNYAIQLKYKATEGLEHTPGPFYFRSKNYPTYYLSFKKGTKEAYIEKDNIKAFFVLPSLSNDDGAVSLELFGNPGMYLREVNSNIDVEAKQGALSPDTFDKDASFKIVPDKFKKGYVALESISKPGLFVRHQGYRLKLSEASEAELFKNDASFSMSFNSEDLSSCKVTDMGLQYEGTLAVSSSGKTCQRWDSQAPHQHTRNDPATFLRDNSLEEANNYCRNPDAEPKGPWCYTTDPAKRWELCNVQKCPQAESCFTKKNEFNTMFGLIGEPGTDNRPDTFYFGNMGDGSVACEKACVLQSKCEAWTWFAPWFAVEEWRGQCYGRSVGEATAAMNAAAHTEYSRIPGVISGVKSITCKECNKVKPTDWCYASGDPHYNTFDRKMIHFMGTCGYTLVQPVPGNDLEVPDFEVVAKNEHRHGRTHVAYVEYTITRVYGLEIKLSLNKEVFVNGVEVNVPWRDHDKVCVEMEGNNPMVTTDFGLRVLYDGHHYVKVGLPKIFARNIEGMCGNWDGNADNDMITKDHRPVGAHDYTEVGNSWQATWIEGDGCIKETPSENKCDETVRASLLENTQCGIMSDPRGPFKQCISTVKPDNIIENCVFDGCMSGEDEKEKALCDMIESYEDECINAGKDVAEWRKPDFCPRECSINMEFSNKASQCPNTCTDLTAETTCESEAQKGCTCKQGYVLSGFECVKVEDCGCTIQNQYFKKGREWGDEECGTKFICEGGNKVVEAILTCADVNAECRTEGGRKACFCKPGMFQHGGR